jgi:hypothetical protein
MPKRLTASTAYSEHDGWYLQRAGRTGEIARRLTAVLCKLASGGPGDDHEVVAGRKLLRGRPEGLSKPPLHPVALHRATELAANRHAQPCLVVGAGTREGIDDEVPAGVRSALTVDALEFTAPREPAALAARAVGHRARA